jgi:protease I
MADKSLAGKKIAVLVESQYIAAEIKCYRERFAGYGAEVHLMSHLGERPEDPFVSEVEVQGKTPETLDVDMDFTQVDLDDYAAVIMAANYTSVRLRFNQEFATDPNAAEPAVMARRAPAVSFFRRAMHNPRIIKGAPCHALWLLTPSPVDLAGRRVTCNPVVLADVLNAGASYVPAPERSNWWEHVVVDGDLVTNASAVHDDRPVGTERLVGAIRDAILNPPAEARPEPTAAAPAASGKRRRQVDTGQRPDRAENDRSARRRPAAAPMGLVVNETPMRGKRDGDDDRAP